MFRDSVKGTGYPLHSPVSPSLPLPYVTVCHHVSTGLYLSNYGLKELSKLQENSCVLLVTQSRRTKPLTPEYGEKYVIWSKACMSLIRNTLWTVNLLRSSWLCLSIGHAASFYENHHSAPSHHITSHHSTLYKNTVGKVNHDSINQ